MAKAFNRKTERFAFRASEEEKSLIEQAAQIRRTTATDFVLEAARDRALEVIEEANQVRLSNEAWDRFCTALDTPGKVLPGLEALIKDPRRYRFGDA